MPDPRKPPKPPKFLAGTEALLYPRPYGVPADFSPAWQAGELTQPLSKRPQTPTAPADAPPPSQPTSENGSSWGGPVDLNRNMLIDVADRRPPPPPANPWALSDRQQRFVDGTINRLPRDVRDRFWSTSGAMFGSRFSPAQQNQIMRNMIARSNTWELMGLVGIQSDGRHAYLRPGHKRVIDTMLRRLPNDEMGNQARAAYRDALSNGSVRISQ